MLVTHNFKRALLEFHLNITQSNDKYSYLSYCTQQISHETAYFIEQQKELTIYGTGASRKSIIFAGKT